MDFIFIIGPSAVGKTTLARELYQQLEGVYIEQNMVPEFSIPASTPDEGIYEEELCWENVLLQTKFFRDKGYKNIVVLDFDDRRAREIPQLFKGCDFIILRLISGDAEQISRQMLHRKENEGGLFAPDNVARSNNIVKSRPLLPNEVMIDVAGKSKEEVLAEAMGIISSFSPLRDYDYEPPEEKLYLSWVQSRNQQ